MNTLLVNTLESALNRYLRADAESSTRLAKMAGKSISIELLPMHLHFNCHFTHDGVQLSTQADPSALTKITGTPLQLLGALLAKKQRQQFFADDVTIEGDAEFAQHVIQLFDHVDIDWEDHASKIIGDVSAHRLGKLFVGMKSWLGTSQQNFSADMKDYLHEETAWFPSKESLRDFFSDIDNLRMDTDRLESRIAHLKSKLDNENTQ